MLTIAPAMRAIVIASRIRGRVGTARSARYEAGPAAGGQRFGTGGGRYQAGGGQPGRASEPRTSRAISRSSRASTTNVRTGAAGADLAVGRSRRPRWRRRRRPTPRYARRVGRPSPNQRRVLADARREHECVQAADRRHHPADRCHEAGAGRHPGRGCAAGRLARRAATTSRMSFGPARPDAAPSGAPARPTASAAADRRAPGARARDPGSTSPERVAITSPASGVNPIVVSTDLPSSTAASDAPAPRWHVTSRNGRRAGAPHSSATRRAT